MSTARRRWITWFAVLAVATVLLRIARITLDKAQITLVFLLVVLLGAMYGGRRLGLALAAAAFLLFNWFFLPPYNTLIVADPRDWFILGAFVVVSVTAAQMFHRLQVEAERARHVDALREADRVRNALLASVSHDLRTPLTSIKVLAHDLVSVDRRAVLIEEEADRLNRMVADLLDLSRVQSRAPVRMEIVPVDDLVGAALQRITAAVGNREVRVEMEDGGTLLVVRCDFTAAVRILGNLLENAVKYSPPTSAIDFTVRQTGDHVELAVSDRGGGVAPAERERIFEAFYRPAGASPDVSSAGLGLAIARGLAELQGGTLVYSPRAGGGSVFTLTLMRAELPSSLPAS